MSKIIDLKVMIKHSTKSAIMVENLNEKNVWLAFSLIELEKEDFNNGDIQEIQLPEWMAIEKELI
tara:strand:- start:516 stop:710 length:195 start_codon:yes stop_codon:yes gene_type:complete